MIVVKFADILEEKKFKISTVVRRTSITRPTLTSLYYGTGRGINFETLNELCSFLNVQPGDILKHYDIDIDACEAWFTSTKTETDEMKHFAGYINFEQPNISDISFYGSFSHARSIPEKHVSDWDVTITIENLTREQYFNNFMNVKNVNNDIAEEIESIVTYKIFDTLEKLISQKDAEAEICDSVYSYKDDTPAE